MFSIRAGRLAAVAVSCLLSCLPVFGQEQLAQTFALNNYKRVLDGHWQAIRYASDGNVYFGSSTHSAHHGAAFFKYDPRTNQITMLAEDLTIICGESPFYNPQGKLHSAIVEMNGWLYMTTHFGVDDSAEIAGAWTGGHLLGYELATGRFRDFGVIHPNHSSYSGVGVDPTRNYVYAYSTGWNGSYIYRYDATSGAKTLISKVAPMQLGSFYWFVDRRGDVWFSLSHLNGTLGRVRGATGQVDMWPNILPAVSQWNAPVPNPDPLWQQSRWIFWMEPLDGDRAIFTMGFNGGFVYMFDSTKPIGSGQEFTPLQFIGHSYLGMTVANNKVYYYQRANMGFGEQEYTDFHLLSVSLDAATGYRTTDHGLLKDQNGRVAWRLPAMASDGGSKVFMVGDWWTIPGDLGTLRYRIINGAETYVQLPRGQFFAIADTSLPYTLAVQSSPMTGLNITGSHAGRTNYNIPVGAGAPVNLTAPASSVTGTDVYLFDRWNLNGSDRSGSVLSFNASGNTTATAIYARSPVSVSPLSVTMTGGQALQFSANMPVNWSLQPLVGTISPSGLYTAPASIGVAQAVTVTATSTTDASKWAIGQVLLRPPLSVTVTPPSASLLVGQSVSFSASVQNWVVTQAVTWSLSGAGALTAAGVYTAPGSIGAVQTATVTATSLEDGSKSASATVTLRPPIAISVSPANRTVRPGQTLQFTAALTNASNSAVTWSLNPVTGSISGTGLYTAPPSLAAAVNVTVTATSVEDGSKSAAVTMTVSPPLSVSVTPAAATLGQGQTQQFTATVSNASNSTVTWSIVPQTGSISSAGIFTAPASVVSPLAVTVKATSNEDSSMFATAVVTATPSTTAGTVLRINAGNTTQNYVDPEGKTWLPDGYYIGGGGGYYGSIAGTNAQWLYQTARLGFYANFSYSLPVIPGSYRVTLKMAELYYTVPGTRIFHVDINGTRVLSNFDILSEVPAATALDKSFVVAAPQGTVDIVFTGVKQFGTVSAIEVVPATGGTPPPVDTTAPVRSAALPSGVLAAGTPQTVLSLTTDEAAACRYGTAPGALFDAMSGVFQTSNGLQHSATVAVASGQAYAYQVRCRDSLGNTNTTDFAIGFSVAAIPPPPPPGDTTPPVRTAGSPSGTLAAGATQATLSVATNESASCRYGATAGVAFDAMAGLFQTSNGVLHTASVAVAASQAYTFQVRCRDAAGNANTTDFGIAFNVAANTPPAAPGLSTVRINSGNTTVNYTDAAGRVWQPDAFFTGGGGGYVGSIAGTTSVPLYQTARLGFYGNFSYSIPVTAGSYQVTLKLAELYYNVPGSRVFHVDINGTRVLSNFDILSEAAPYTAIDKAFVVAAPAGKIDIVFTGVKQFGTVSAIEVIPATGGAVDTVPPVRSGASPLGQQPGGTTQAVLSLAANEAANCRYSASPGVGFDAMSGIFQSANGLAHTATVTGLAAGQSYLYHTRCRDLSGNTNTDDYTISFSVPAAAPAPGVETTTLRLNCGNNTVNYTDPAGRIWLPDNYYTGGGGAYAGNVLGTNAVPLYQTARMGGYANFQYSIPVAAGSYRVTLKFAELYYNAAGTRIFHVDLNGTRTLADFDILRETAPFTALDKSFTVAAPQGKIDIVFTGVKQFGIISAIEIVPAN